MFPTPVGMNRSEISLWNGAADVPHACGDEPWNRELDNNFAVMFPTPVGMNRLIAPGAQRRIDVPHACGDEPLTPKQVKEVETCSPRLWG